MPYESTDTIWYAVLDEKGTTALSVMANCKRIRTAKRGLPASGQKEKIGIAFALNSVYKINP